MTQRDRILIILGLPRSGASALALAVEAVGFALPGDAIDPTTGDDRSAPHEPQAMVRLNDGLLARKGAWWGRIGRIEIAPEQNAMHQALEDSFGAAVRIAIKDPRLTLLMPAWRAALEQIGPVGALINLRHPGEAATSLARRHGIGADAAYLMWIHYLLSALDDTEGLSRALILFPDWIDDIDSALMRISVVADMPAGHDAAEAIAARLRRDAVHGGQQLTATDPEIDLLAGDLFALAARHARDGSVPSRSEIAPFRSRFDNVAAAARDAEAMASLRLSDLQAQLDIQAVRAQRLAEEADAAARSNAALRAEIASLRHAQDASVTPQETPRPAAPALAPPRSAETQTNTAPAGFRAVVSRLFGRALPNRKPPTANMPEQDAPDDDPHGAKSDIFILSTVAWDNHPRRPHHLANALAKAGHRVFHVETLPGDGIPKKVAPNIYQLRLPGAGQTANGDISDPLSPVMQRAWINQFHAVADHTEVTSRAHVLITHPFWWTLARHLSTQFQIAADWDETVPVDPALLPAQQQMIAGSDRLILSSQAEYDRYSAQRPAHLIRNGADIDHFLPETGAQPTTFPLAPRRAGAIRIGYAGAISDRIDLGLLQDIAGENPDFDLHFCGPVTIPVSQDLHNLSLHGDIPYADLPAFLAAMDVLIAPFGPAASAISGDPIQLYDAAAAGKPIVATAMPELVQAGEPVTIARDAAAFAQAIRSAAEKAKNPMTAANLRAFALENAWSYRAANLIAALDDTPLLTVVIPVTGPAAPTLACLQMLTGHGTAYPALQILLIDAGSDPAAQEDLRVAMDADRRIRLLAGPTDLVAAAAFGAKAARGQFIMLLDRHGRVAAGALSAMVGHLQRDPQLDVIGPMVEDPTDDSDRPLAPDMAAVARRGRDLVTGYRGLSTPGVVDAAFCAMFRSGDLDRILGALTAGKDDLRQAGLTTALAEDAYVHRPEKPQAVQHLEQTAGKPGATPPRIRPAPSLPDSPAPPWARRSG